MRKILIGGVAVLALVAMAACHPVEIHDHHHHGAVVFGEDGWNSDSDSGWMSNDKTALKTIAALTCPDTEGDLSLTNKAPDGKSCDYSGRHDDTVHLTLMALTGTPQETLSPLETELKGLMPPPKTSAVNVESSNDGSGHDHAKVDLPFFHVDANGNKADVKIFGTTIHSDGHDNATIHTDMGLKNTTIHAGDNGAEIQSQNVGALNTHFVYILAGESAPVTGYHAVGYIAAGPNSGPLVVAEFKSKSEHQHGSMDHGDIGALLKANLQP